MAEYDLNFGAGQKKRIQKAWNKRKGVHVLCHKNVPGGEKVACLLNDSQIKKWNASPDGMAKVHFRHEDLKENHSGGLLPFLIPILASVASAAVSSSVASAIAKSGNGLILNKGRKSFLIQPRDDDGLIILPRKMHRNEGSGLFLKKDGDGLYLKKDGHGLYLKKDGDGLYLKKDGDGMSQSSGSGLYLRKYGQGKQQSLTLLDRNNIPNFNKLQRNLLLDIV